MTAFTPHHPDQFRFERQGWLCSVIVHAVMGACAVAVVSTLRMPLEPDQFRWNVALVTPPKPLAKAETLPEPKPTPPTPQVVKRQSPPQPVIQQVHQAVEPVRQMVSQQIVHRVTRTVETVNQTASTVVHQSVQASEVTKTAATETREAVVQEERPVMTAPAVSRQESEPVVTHVQAAESVPVTASQPVVHREAEPVAQRPIVESTGGPAAQQAVVEQTVAYAPVVKQMPATKADYGWLISALLGRVNELKRYPHFARINRWEGKVVLLAVIKDTGEVLQVDVHESSGRAILDNDAVETLRKASPIKLDHPLGRPQMPVLIPISYSIH